jgi:hypothetical protein
LIDTEDWAQISRAEREQISFLIGRVCREEIERAVTAHTFDSRVDRFLGRLALWLDDEGFRELSDSMTVMTEEAFAIQERTLERIRDKGGEGSPARAMLTLFEMPDPAPRSAPG